MGNGMRTILAKLGLSPFNGLAIVHFMAFALSLAGSIQLVRKKVLSCYTLWIVANAFWMAWALARKDYMTLVTFAMYTVLSIIGYVNWREEHYG